MRKSFYETTQQAIENALLDLFTASTVEKQEKIENSLYRHIENILKAMAKKRTLDKIFYRRIKRRTQPTSFMGAFIWPGTSPLLSKRPVVNYVLSHMEQTAEKWCTPAKAEAVPPLELSDPWSEPPSLSTFSDQNECKKYSRARRNAQASKAKYLGKENPIQNRY